MCTLCRSPPSMSPESSHPAATPCDRLSAVPPQDTSTHRGSCYGDTRVCHCSYTFPLPPLPSLTFSGCVKSQQSNTRYDNKPLARTAHVRHLPCLCRPRLTTTSFSLYCNYAECLELTHQGNDFHHHLRIKHWGLNILVLMLVIIISQSLLLQLQSLVLSLQITFCMMLSTTQKQLFVKPVSQSVSTHSPEQWSEEMRW